MDFDPNQFNDHPKDGAGAQGEASYETPLKNGPVPPQGRPPKRQKKDSDGYGIASMVLGIISIVLFCSCINVITGVLAVIFGILQLVENRRRWMAIVGIVTGALSIVLLIVSWGLILSSPAAYDIRQNPEEYFDSNENWDDLFNHGRITVHGDDGDKTYEFDFDTDDPDATDGSEETNEM